MMILRSSDFSPFARKVRIAAMLTGLDRRIGVVAADTMSADDPLRSDNPLGKLPVLIAENGQAIYDSSVIVQYLDMMSGGGLLIPTGARRFTALTTEALADGILDALILQRYELSFRPEAERSAKWVAHQQGKVDRAMALLESCPPADGDVSVGAIAVACALGYQDIRFEGAWRKSYPNLVAWLDRFRAGVPAYDATAPKV